MTTDAIPDLWGPINVDVVSPLAVLRSQAGRLAGHTKGLLTADVRSASDDTGWTHTFQIVVPALNGYRYSLFDVAHERDMIYPVRLMFRPWQEEDRPPSLGNEPRFNPQIITALTRVQQVMSGQKTAHDKQVEESQARSAETAEVFVELVGKILTAGYTRAVIDSLIAKSNEAVESPPAA